MIITPVQATRSQPNRLMPAYSRQTSSRPLQSSFGLPALAMNTLKPLSVIRFASQAYHYPPEQNLLYSLKQRAENNPNGIAIENSQIFAPDEKPITHRELYKDALKVARMLKEQYNIKPGDRVAAIETNTPEFIKLFFGSLAIGAAVVPINILSLADKAGASEKLAHMLKVSNSKVLFIGKVIDRNPDFKDLKALKRLEPLLKPGKRFVLRHALSPVIKPLEFCPKLPPNLAEFRSKLQKLKLMLDSLPSGMKIITPQDTQNFALVEQTKPLHPADVLLKPTPRQESIMLFTSGTSATPKGVAHTHQSIVHNTQAVKSAVAPFFTKNDKQLILLPLFHIFGLSVLLSGMEIGMHNVFVPSASEALKNPQKLLDMIEAQKITVLPLIPELLETLLKQPGASEKMKSVRVAITGGEKQSESLFNQFHQLLPQAKLWDGWGMTEIGIPTLNTSGEYGNVGQSISPYVEIKLHEPDANGAGEIWIQSPSAVEKYYGATAEDTQEMFKPDGWVSTGDIGEFTPDGSLKIVGRKKEIIKRQGEMLSPQDFDARLIQFLKLQNVMTFAYAPPGSEKKKIVSIVGTPRQKGALAKFDEASLKETLQYQVESGAMARRYVPHYILTLPQSEFPTGFLSPLGKKQYKNARAYLNNLVQSGAIQFASDNNILIQKPEQL